LFPFLEIIALPNLVFPHCMSEGVVVAFFGFGKLASISQKLKIIPKNVKLGYGQKEY